MALCAEEKEKCYMYNFLSRCIGQWQNRFNCKGYDAVWPRGPSSAQQFLFLHNRIELTDRKTWETRGNADGWTLFSNGLIVYTRTMTLIIIKPLSNLSSFVQIRQYPPNRRWKGLLYVKMEKNVGNLKR